MKKIVLLAPLLFSLILLSPPVFAEPTQTFHVEGKAAVAWDSNVAYVVVEGLINTPDGTPIKGTNLLIITGSDVRCIPLCKNSFKWSMDHASLCLSWLEIKWCTNPPTRTSHINIRNYGHVVINKEGRGALATVSTRCYCSRTFCGLVLHGTGMLAFSLPEV